MDRLSIADTEIEPAPSPDDRVGGVVLGRYRLMQYMAAGGMGAIYLARAEGAAGFVRPVIIKRLLWAHDVQASRMFAREARILSQLRHPAIVSVHDFAEEGADHLMVLDYVHGYTLAEWVSYLRRSQRDLPVDLAVHVVLRVLEALQYAHGLSLGVVHRDIKPSNVLIDVQGDIKLADFGIARTEAEVTDVTVTDASLKGTFAYMAPELFARARPEPATDVYSAAVMLYAVLAGGNPFSHPDVPMIIGRVVNYEPDRLDVIRPDVPAALAAVIAAGMSKRPEERFAAAADFAAALRATGVLGAGVDERFRAAIAADFGAATFASLLGVASLEAREAAWSARATTANGATGANGEPGEGAPPPSVSAVAAPGDAAARTRDTSTATESLVVARGPAPVRRATTSAPPPPESEDETAPRSGRGWLAVGLLLVAVAIGAAGLAWRQGLGAVPLAQAITAGGVPPQRARPAAPPRVAEHRAVAPEVIVRAPDVSPPPEAAHVLADLRALPVAAGHRSAAAALHRDALLAHRAQRYREAERLWADAARADPAWEGPFYNLACVAALEGRIDDARAYLELMRQRGVSWQRVRRLETDPDLAAVRARAGMSAWIDELARGLLIGSWAARASDDPACARLVFEAGALVRTCGEAAVSGSWRYHDGVVTPDGAAGVRIVRLADDALCVEPAEPAEPAAPAVGPRGCYRRVSAASTLP